MKRLFGRSCNGLVVLGGGALAVACAPEGSGSDDDEVGSLSGAAEEIPVSERIEASFDPNDAPEDDFSVVGALRPASFSWGEIELLEGHQRFRTEGYNRRTMRLRRADTFQSAQYPLRTYFGDLNQQIVDAFNLAYDDDCAEGTSRCEGEGPTRPAARHVALHKGPLTAEGECDAESPPALLVHGAMQNANVWLFPFGNDGEGGTFEGGEPATGLVQTLEDAGRCAYAVTFGNFHGDNYNHAIGVANAISRVRELGGAEAVDVVAWSKGVLAVNTYLTNAADWDGFGSRFFDALAAEQASSVPRYRDDVRSYVALSGPHGGIDLNFRHPIHTLTVASTSYNAPIGRGPMPWTFFSAVQCVTWGPDSPWFENPYAKSVCEGRGGTWPDYFRRIHVSNVTGLSEQGIPEATHTLSELNAAQGLSESDFDFDEYNISLFGSVDDDGRHMSAYLGQLQAARDLRDHYPIPVRDSFEWRDVDPDEDRWFPWIGQKLTFNPMNPAIAAGYLDDDDHTACRGAAYEAHSDACSAYHFHYDENREGQDALGYGRYRLFEGLGIAAAEEMGGHFIERLSEQSIDPRLSSLYVLYGDVPAEAGQDLHETDGAECVGCDSQGDGVLFEASIAGRDQLTQDWPGADREARTREESLPLGHLEIGASPEATGRIVDHFEDLDAD